MDIGIRDAGAVLRHHATQPTIFKAICFEEKIDDYGPDQKNRHNIYRQADGITLKLIYTINPFSLRLAPLLSLLRYASALPDTLVVVIGRGNARAMNRSGRLW